MGAIVARWDVVSAIVAVVVRVVVVGADGGYCRRHGLYVVFTLYLWRLFCGSIRSSDLFFNVEMMDEGLDLGKHRTDLRPSEDLMAFLSFLSATSHL